MMLYLDNAATTFKNSIFIPFHTLYVSLIYKSAVSVQRVSVLAFICRQVRHIYIQNAFRRLCISINFCFIKSRF